MPIVHIGFFDRYGLLHIIFLALVALKLLVSLITRLVACSARKVVDRQTDKQTHGPSTITLAARARGGLINPRRACAARVTVVVLCVCVGVGVYDYSRNTGYKAAYELYKQLQCYKGKKNDVAILLKRLRSRDMA